MFLIRFWSNLTKKDSVESAKYEINKFILVLTVLGRFFSWIRIRICPDRIRIFGRSGLRKEFDPDPGKKTWIRSAGNKDDKPTEVCWKLLGQLKDGVEEEKELRDHASGLHGEKKIISLAVVETSVSIYEEDSFQKKSLT